VRVFFYGTLMDADVRARVVGASLIEPARLAGWRRVGLIGRPYPVIVHAPGAETAGLLARAIDRAGWRRLLAYEGDEYRVIAVRVTAADGCAISALTFAASAAARPGPRLWSFDGWHRRHKQTMLAPLRGPRRAARSRRTAQR